MEEVSADVVIIGAGISGVVTAKCMRDVGYKVLLLEKSNDIGGLWTFKEKSYGVMKFTHINVSKHNYCFSDFPFPEDATDYPHNSEMAKYIQAYADHFQLNDVIVFQMKVNYLERKGDKWIIRAEKVNEMGNGTLQTTGEEITYTCQFVAIATGHHAKPVVAKFDGEKSFPGKIYHSVEYNDVISNGAVEKKVVIVGIGNSAVDVACNCASVGRCKPVYVSTRSGAWVVPNYILGHPTDLYACRLFLWLPWKLATKVFELVVTILQGSPFKWGLNPKMHALQTQPTVSPTMIHHIQRGNIVVKPNIKKIDGREVQFTDGSKVESDHIILCTGYKIDLPFLSQELQNTVVDNNTNELKLYKNVFSPDIGHSMAFIGFVQPASGGVLPMSEIQARWWAELCKKNVRLPQKSDMEANMKEEMEYVRNRWFNSTRHTIQRDPIIYNDDIGSIIGCRPEFTKHPWLAWRLLLGSCGAYQYRLQGPGKWSDAEYHVKRVPVTGFMIYGTAVATIVLLILLYYFFGSVMDILGNLFDYE